MFQLALAPFTSGTAQVYFAISQDCSSSYACAGNYYNPAYLQFLIHIEDKLKMNDFITLWARSTMLAIATELGTEVTSRLYTVYCPLSLYIDIKSTSKCDFTIGDSFSKMSETIKKTRRNRRSDSALFERRRLIIEVQRSVATEDARWKQYSSIMRQPCGIVLQRVADIIQHGSGLLDVTLSDNRYVFEHRPATVANQAVEHLDTTTS